MDTNEIKAVITTYFDASYESDGEKMGSVFHDAAHVYGLAKDGALRDMDRPAFMELVTSTAPPSFPPDYPRQNEILSIDFTGTDTAVARVKLRLRDIMFTDILSFMRIDGKWLVISKVFAPEPIE